MGKLILLVDFDGVIHGYDSGWKGADIVPDPPVPEAIDWLDKASEFWDVYIYSSRSKDHKGIEAMKNWLQYWGNGVVEKVTFCHEKPAAFLTIDDRAICFDGDWSKLDPQELLSFKPWNKQ
jgi:hypothetical protein